MGDSLKRKLKTRTFCEKYKILKDIDKGSFYVSVAKNYISKQTLSQWIKGKQKIYATVESNSSTKKRQLVHQSSY